MLSVAKNTLCHEDSTKFISETFAMASKYIIQIERK